METSPGDKRLTFETCLTSVPRAGLLAGALLALGFAAGCQPDEPPDDDFASPPAPAPAGDPSLIDLDTARVMEVEAELAPVADRIEDASADLPGFAGLAIDGSRGAVVVYLTDVDDEAAFDRVAALAGDTDVVLEPAVLDRAGADRLTQLLEQARADLEVAGVSISELGPSGSGGRYQLRVSSDPDVARTVLVRRFGREVAASIDVSWGEPLQLLSRWADTQSAVRVTSAHHPRVGEHLCTSGSFSGQRCGAIVGGWSWIYDEDGIQHALWYAEQAIDASITGRGDSGGPVYMVWSGGVSARGLISGGTLPVACPPGRADTGCFARVHFGDIAQVAARHGMQLTGF